MRQKMKINIILVRRKRLKKEKFMLNFIIKLVNSIFLQIKLKPKILSKLNNKWMQH